jgi:hypothetical protein
VILGLGFVAFTGYFTGIETAYGWARLTRMAIHTAAGFIVLGCGFLALAWVEEKSIGPAGRVPRWLPLPIGITGTTVTIAPWQALMAHEQQMQKIHGTIGSSYADDGLLLFGVLLTIGLVLITWIERSASEQARRTMLAYAPHVILGLGALLSLSIYGLLARNFEASYDNGSNPPSKIMSRRCNTASTAIWRRSTRFVPVSTLHPSSTAMSFAFWCSVI